MACLALLWTGLAGGPETFRSEPRATFTFHGPVGDRIQANLDHWLLPAPDANPGLLEMFRVRDRQPAPQIVPWAGEFVGKYLIAAIQNLRLTHDPRLERRIADVIAAFLATQAEDGYLGPFPKDVRLLKHWDLWGHYHALQALLLWHERTGDAAALAAATRAADLVCATYLDTGHRVLEAGDPEMNMSILTGLVQMHRVTGNPRYLRLAREVEQDWEQAGDYLRSGLDGREFFQSPRPRWESLHDLQGLLELWRVTGDARYRDAFTHHWRSIRRWDRRNTGGFSSGEQATGNPYAPTAIETCCTVAWMVLTTDYLRLTGEPAAADDLELATFNAGLGAQHPSGRWWTYNTPMDGVREASAHTIVFQSRAGTPELNCCSVNAPRVLGLLSEWAVMSAPDGLVLNWLGPFEAVMPLADGTSVRLAVESGYPVNGDIRVKITPSRPRTFNLRVRIPGWADGASAALNRATAAAAASGRYLELSRRWKKGDTLRLTLPVDNIRAVPGAEEAAGRISLYRGPLLLAWDQRFNPFDEDRIPAIDPAAPLTPVSFGPGAVGLPRPWLLGRVQAAGGQEMMLCDFASAGATGTRYRTWLTPVQKPPPPAFTQLPADGVSLPPGPVRFQWRGERRPQPELTGYRLRLTPLPPAPGSTPIGLTTGVTNRLTFDLAADGRFADGSEWFWEVEALGPTGITRPDLPPARFRVSRSAPPQALPAEPVLGPDGEILVHDLRSDAPPAFGRMLRASFTRQDAEGTTLNGRDQMLVYAVPAWPEEDFTVAARIRLENLPTNRIAQVFSAWCGAMDDPLRLVIDGGRLFARIEAGGVFSTPGVPVTAGGWRAVAAVKRSGTLTLYVDGRPAGSTPAPALSRTRSVECALGGNPRYGGNEFLAAGFADFYLYGRALSGEDVARWGGAAP